MDEAPIIVQMGNEPRRKPVPVCAQCGTNLKRGKCPDCKPDQSDGWRAL